MRVGSPFVALLVLALPFVAFLLLALVRPLRRSAPAAATVSIAAIWAAVLAAFWLSWRARPPLAGDLTVALGRALVGPFALVVELLGVLLVIALLGALYFARSEP